MALVHRPGANDVVTAVYGALNVAAFTTLSSGGVYNQVPQKTGTPYTLISAPTGSVVDCFQGPGTEIEVHVHAVSGPEYAGDEANDAIIKKACDLIDDMALSIGNHTLAGVRYQGHEIFAENVNGIEYRHMVGRFRFLVFKS